MPIRLYRETEFVDDPLLCYFFPTQKVKTSFIINRKQFNHWKYHCRAGYITYKVQPKQIMHVFLAKMGSVLIGVSFLTVFFLIQSLTNFLAYIKVVK